METGHSRYKQLFTRWLTDRIANSMGEIKACLRHHYGCFSFVRASLVTYLDSLGRYQTIFDDTRSSPKLITSYLSQSCCLLHHFLREAQRFESGKILKGFCVLVLSYYLRNIKKFNLLNIFQRFPHHSLQGPVNDLSDVPAYG